MRELTNDQLVAIQRANALGFISNEEFALTRGWNAQIKEWRNLPGPPPPEAPIKELRIQRRVIELEIKDYSKGRHTTYRTHLRLNAERNLPLIDARIAKALDEIANPSPPYTPPEPPSPLPLRIGLITDLLGQIALSESRLSTELANTSLVTKKGLNAADVDLCNHWANISNTANSNSAAYYLNTLLNSQGSYRACQLLSARAAEHIAIDYYERLGHAVTDVSVSQNLDGNEDWKTFDLRVGPRAVDVKNARESFNGNGNFVEHCVPRFKQERATNAAVRILGIVSAYIADCRKYLEPYSEAVVLGEVNELEIRELCDWSKQRFGPALDLQAIWRPNFIPGWIFEYPPEHYSRRVDEIAAIPGIIKICQATKVPADAIPGWLLILCPEPALIDQLTLTPDLRKMVQELRSIGLSIGLSRRSLVVYAMGITLESLVDLEDPSEKLSQLRKLIVLTVADLGSRSILGLHDPRGYALSMIESLARIGHELYVRRLEITGFKLTHPAILIGTVTSGSRLTLLAYCGGWMSTPVRARCGTTPLVFGPNEHCESCGHLVCKNCGHCSTGCILCNDRQVFVAEESAQLITHKSGKGHSNWDDDSESY